MFKFCTSLTFSCSKLISHVLRCFRPVVNKRMSSLKTPHDDKNSSEENSVKRPRRESTGSLNSGVFWDIENIPVKKSIAERRVPEIKRAIGHFVTKVNHFNEAPITVNIIHKFIAVARQKGENTPETTAEIVKQHLLVNQIDLLDLPYKNDPDYCDDVIYRSVLTFTEEHVKCLVVALTGDVGLIQRINTIPRDFNLIIVMQRAGKKTSVIQRHCDKVKQTNDRGRQQAVYFIDEVIRKCLSGGVPLTFSHLLRLKSARGQDNFELDDDHFGILFNSEIIPIVETAVPVPVFENIESDDDDSAYGSESGSEFGSDRSDDGYDSDRETN